MRINNTNSSVLQNIRQPTRLNESNSLVFVYPFIIDKSLELKYGTLLRNFFSTQFMSQIKTSNVLNIVSTASKHSITNNQLEKIANPAEMMAQNDALSLLTRTPTTNSDSPYTDYRNDIHRHEYQQKIDQFKDYIYNQVRLDPRFSDVNPLISSITIENLIDIPLIIGTKSSGIQPIPLFWILFFATGQYREDFDTDTFLTPNHRRPGEDVNLAFTRSIRMDRPQSFEYIKRFTKLMNNASFRFKYENFLEKIQTIPGKSVPSNRVSKLMHGIDTEMDKALKVFTRATNEQQYSEEVGFSQNASVSINNAYLDSSDLSTSTKIKAQNLFTSFVANYLVPIVKSAATTLITVDEINIVKYITELTDNLLQSFMEKYSILDMEIKSILVNRIDDTSTDTAITQLGSIEKMCQANAQIAVLPIFSKLRTISFTLTSNQRNDIIKFIDDLMEVSSQLNVYKKGILSNLVSIAQANGRVSQELTRSFNTYQEEDKSIAVIFYKFFTANNDHGAIAQRGPNPGDPYLTNNRLIQFLGNQNLDIERYLQQISYALGSICSFMAYYTFFSYLCEFLGEIKAKVDVQKKDALDFPNYCLVFRKEVIESLYGALASINYKKEAEIEEFDEEEARNNAPGIYNTAKKTYTTHSDWIKRKLKIPTDPVKTKPINHFTNFKINETDIMQMIRVLNNRLNIPNLIVVDEKANTVYYKWMYSGSYVGKLTSTTIQNYVQQQKEIL